ncbi:hypothetical protein [Arthrobacter polaris]|nr:hypothetical protein [Arthrobacter polaris]UIK89351.1 hypothetical protein J0916_02495 [Arthrobacter polaris]
MIFLAFPMLWRTVAQDGIMLDLAAVGVSILGYAGFLCWRRKTLVLRG